MQYLEAHLLSHLLDLHEKFPGGFCYPFVDWIWPNLAFL